MVDGNRIKNNGYVGSAVIYSADVTYTEENAGYYAADEPWYEDSMSDLDVYAMSDEYADYVVLSACNTNVTIGSTALVYGTVIDVNESGIVYIAAQIIK